MILRCLELGSPSQMETNRFTKSALKFWELVRYIPYCGFVGLGRSYLQQLAPSQHIILVLSSSKFGELVLDLVHLWNYSVIICIYNIYYINLSEYYALKSFRTQLWSLPVRYDKLLRTYILWRLSSKHLIDVLVAFPEYKYQPVQAWALNNDWIETF